MPLLKRPLKKPDTKRHNPANQESQVNSIPEASLATNSTTQPELPRESASFQIAGTGSKETAEDNEFFDYFAANLESNKKASQVAAGAKKKKTVNAAPLPEEDIFLAQSNNELTEELMPANLSQYEQLEWVHKQRNVGLYVQCDSCDKWRYMPMVRDPLELPEKWFCNMNPEKRYNFCEAPEIEIKAEVQKDLIHNLYSSGSLVWAKLPGFPWWPAMVDDCPDVLQYYWLDKYGDIDVPTHYNVTFFDSDVVSRAWLKTKQLMPYSTSTNKIRVLGKNEQKFKTRLAAAKKQASEAPTYTVKQRLETFSFLARWPKASFAKEVRNNVAAKEPQLKKKKHEKSKVDALKANAKTKPPKDNRTLLKDKIKEKGLKPLAKQPKNTKKSKAVKTTKNKDLQKFLQEMVKEISEEISAEENNTTTTSSNYDFDSWLENGGFSGCSAVRREKIKSESDRVSSSSHGHSLDSDSDLEFLDEN